MMHFNYRILWVASIVFLLACSVTCETSTDTSVDSVVTTTPTATTDTSVDSVVPTNTSVDSVVPTTPTATTAPTPTTFTAAPTPTTSPTATTAPTATTGSNTTTISTTTTGSNTTTISTTTTASTRTTVSTTTTASTRTTGIPAVGALLPASAGSAGSTPPQINVDQIFMPQNASLIDTDYRVKLLMYLDYFTASIVVAEDICYQIESLFTGIKEHGGVCWVFAFVPVDGNMTVTAYIDFPRNQIQNESFLKLLTQFEDEFLLKYFRVIEVAVMPLVQLPELLTGNIIVTFGGYWYDQNQYLQPFKPPFANASKEFVKMETAAVCRLIRKALQLSGVLQGLYPECSNLIFENISGAVHATLEAKFDKDELQFLAKYNNSEQMQVELLRLIRSINNPRNMMLIASAYARHSERRSFKHGTDIEVHFTGLVKRNRSDIEWKSNYSQPLDPLTLNLTSELCKTTLQQLISVDAAFNQVGVLCEPSDYRHIDAHVQVVLRMWFPRLGLLNSGVYGSLRGFNAKIKWATTESPYYDDQLRVCNPLLEYRLDNRFYDDVPQKFPIVYSGYAMQNGTVVQWDKEFANKSSAKYISLFETLCKEIRNGLGATFGDINFLHGECKDMMVFKRGKKTWVDFTNNYPKYRPEDAGIFYNLYHFIQMLEKYHFVAAAQSYFAHFDIRLIFTDLITRLRT